MPRFYKEVWLSYYSCRPKIEIQDLSPYNFLTSIIWGNKYFQFKGKCILKTGLMLELSMLKIALIMKDVFYQKVICFVFFQ